MKNIKIKTKSKPKIEKTVKAAKKSAKKAAKKAVLPAHIIGTFSRKSSGIGFVRPLDAVDYDNDILIPLRNTLEANDGDVVKIELVKDEGQPQQSHQNHRFKRRRQRDMSHNKRLGNVIGIVERLQYFYVGSFINDNKTGHVRIDGTHFDRPFRVDKKPVNYAVHDGDKVIVSIVSHESSDLRGVVSIEGVIGKIGEPDVDKKTVFAEYGLTENFPPKVLTEAAQVVHEFFNEFPNADAANRKKMERTSDIDDGRIDITKKLVVTIDPEDAHDFDDGISLERKKNGNWRLGVHIADVAYFVRHGSNMDKEARERATSVYLPGDVVPMLPEVISNGLASLQPDKKRLAKTVYLEFTSAGIRTHVDVKRTIIRSAQRLNYSEVQQFFDEEGVYEGAEYGNSSSSIPRDGSARNCDNWNTGVRELLLNMHELAMLLRQRRFARGSVEMNMPDVKILLGDSGEVVGAFEYPYYDSNRIIEEFMLAANEAVADFLAEHDYKFLRRVHTPPSYKKVKAFADFVRSLNIADINPEAILESRFVVQKVLDNVKGKKEERAVNYALLRSMQRAKYSPVREGHYALASECYCHFTSPIRRYPDLTIHRLLDNILDESKPRQDEKTLTSLGDHCSKQERRAESAERELTKLKLINYMSSRVGTKMTGIITGVENFGMFVRGVEIPAEGLIKISSMRGDHYRFDYKTQQIIGTKSGNIFRLGDTIEFVVKTVDANRRLIEYGLES
ncbi:MAG: RNB domain-containing ribonuclease [Planctomycetaceae bacterium]|jgi:ribonuclease R|nr:RNB domain-containing ribonuclease [Planctomycetaceae bacterium]